MYNSPALAHILYAMIKIASRRENERKSEMTETIKMKNVKSEEHNAFLCYVLWIALAEAVGALAGWITREGNQYFNTSVAHPPFTAPSWVFPLAWTALYALMGIGSARVFMAHRSASRSRALAVFIVQLVFNFFWPILFFNIGSYSLALVWIAALFIISIMMTAAFRRIDDAAGLLQVPYLIWLGYAIYLNAGVWLMTK